MKVHRCPALIMMFLGAQSCGARSGLGLVTAAANGELGADSAAADGALGAESGTANGDGNAEDAEDGATESVPVYMFCALNSGPVALCTPTPQTGPIQVCDSNFPDCVKPSGFNQWACCTRGGGPYNGPSGDCRFPGPRAC
jgi:hypothetical protein